MPPETDDDLIVTIPDETVTLKDGEPEKAPDPAPEKKEPAKQREPGWRASAIAKDPDRDAERLREIERERDEAAAARAEAEARARAMEEAAKAATAAAADADGRAALREQQAMRAHWARLESEKAQLDQAVASTQMQAQAAEQALERAAEMGDAKAQAAAQRALAKAEADLSQLQSGLHVAERELASTRQTFEEHLRRQQQAEEARAREVAARPEPKQPQQQAPQTPEAWIDTQARQVLGEQGAEFLRANKNLVADPKLNKRFLRFADYYAEKHGQSALKSSDFLDAVAQEFEIASGDAEEKPEPTRAPTRRTASAAPVNRGAQHFSSRNLNASTVKLPPRLAAEVKAMGLDPVKYAISTVQLIKDGKLPKTYLDPDYDHGL